MQYGREECGRRIAKLRIKNGYTQERLADALNMDRSILSRVEAGKRTLPVDWFVQLAAMFNVSLDYLIIGKITPADIEILKDEINELVMHLEDFSGKL